MNITLLNESDYPNNLIIDFSYVSKAYYDVSISMSTMSSWQISFELKTFEDPFMHEEKVTLFTFYKENAEYYAIINEKDEQVAWMCVGKTDWKNTARIWDIYVQKDYLRQGLGTQLINLAEERAKTWKCRAMEIETQTSNYKAISFYLKHGYKLSGLDSICYTNQDLERKNVRIELMKLFNE